MGPACVTTSESVCLFAVKPAQQTRLYRVNGIDMKVVIAGEGPEVLLVHGFPDSHTVWRKQIPALVAAGYRVIAPDTRGCGETQSLTQSAASRFCQR